MGRPIRDLAGQRFGRLAVMRATDERASNHVIWECLCDCGNTCMVSSNRLIAKRTRSCGCLRRETARETGRHFNDLARQRFGRLVAIAPTDNNSRSITYKMFKIDLDDT